MCVCVFVTNDDINVYNVFFVNIESLKYKLISFYYLLVLTLNANILFRN